MSKVIQFPRPAPQTGPPPLYFALDMQGSDLWLCADPHAEPGTNDYMILSANGEHFFAKLVGVVTFAAARDETGKWREVPLACLITSKRNG
jgi:hypothetical protein